MKPKKAFVTGGTGFLGINLIQELCRQGWDVVALHRPTSNIKYLKKLPVKLVLGDITDATSLQGLIPENTDVVFHVAADTNQWSKGNAIQTKINVLGTKNLINAALENNVKRFVHTSSISAWGPAKGLINEDTPQLGETSWINYEKTKWQGEREAFKGIDQGLEVVVVNPGSIVGAYDTSTWAVIFYALKAKEIPGLPPGRNSFIHVSDVVKGLILAAEKGRSGENYLVCGEPGFISEFAEEACRIMGIKKVPPRIPGIALKIFTYLSVFIARFTGKKPTVTPEVAAMTSRKDYQFSDAKARKELGYSPRPWKQGVKESYEWLVAEGLL